MTLVRRVARPMLAAIFVVQGLERCATPPRSSAKVGARSPSRLAGRWACPTTPSSSSGPTAPRWSAAERSSPPGRVPRLASLVLAASIVPTTLCGHPFWEETDPAQARPADRTSSRTSASSAACCSPRSTPRASRGWPTAPASPRHARRAHRQARQARGQASRATRAGPPRGQAGRVAGPRRPHLTRRPATAVHRSTALTAARRRRLARPARDRPGRRRPSPCPGSKSLTNRFLVLAALANGPSRLRRPLRSRDTLLMAQALRALGARVEDTDGARPPSAPTGWSPRRPCAAAPTSTAASPAR